MFAVLEAAERGQLRVQPMCQLQPCERAARLQGETLLLILLPTTTDTPGCEPLGFVDKGDKEGHNSLVTVNKSEVDTKPFLFLLSLSTAFR